MGGRSLGREFEGRLNLSEARRQVCAGVQGKGVGIEALRQGSLGGSRRSD